MQNARFAAYKKLFILFFSLLFCNTLISQEICSETLWVKGEGEYNNYRIPSLIVTKARTVLAFCEGREGGDAGDIDVLVKRSLDNGQTWGEESIVWDDNDNTCGNPCPVVEEETGRIWLFMTWNLGADHERLIVRKESKDTRRPFLSYSDDDGKTWSTPVDMSDSCKDPDWGWYATGPGVAIQLSSAPYQGRLVIPANHSYDDPDGNIRKGPFGYGSHVLISDDKGKTWRKSEPIRPGCNESQVVELPDGSLIMNMRSYNDKYCRAIAKSVDGGETWSDIWHDYQLVESKCQASFINYGDYEGKEMILFSNPAVPIGRTHMTIKTSFDQAKSWSNAKLIHAGPSAYSCMTKLADNRIGLLFEGGKNTRYQNILFLAFPANAIFKPDNIMSIK